MAQQEAGECKEKERLLREYGKIPVGFSPTGTKEDKIQPSLHRAAAVLAARRALLNTSWMLEPRLSPPVSSFTLASRKGVVSLPWMPWALA